MSDNRSLLDEFYVRAAFKSELAAISDIPLQKITIEMLRRAHPRFFTGPSSGGKFHPKDEFFSGPKGDVSGAPPNRGKEYGGQVLHVRRVAKFVRHLCKAHMWDTKTPHFQLAMSAALVHDIAKYNDNQKGTVHYHEALVEDLTRDIINEHPEWEERWRDVIRLCEVHSGQWGKDESYYPETELEKLIHDADYLASRRSTGEINVDEDDFSR